MTPTMAQRVAGRHLATASEKQELLWSSDQIVKVLRKLEDIYLVLTARDHSGPPYEGYESIADGNSVVARSMQDMQKASESLTEVAKALRAAGVLSKRANANSLDGMDKRTGLRRINAVIAASHLNGIFRDDHWIPIQRLLKKFADEGILTNILSADYAKDDQGRPSSKTWKFTVEWQDPKGRPVTVYGQIVASGAGSVDNPLDAYDVVAYAN